MSWVAHFLLLFFVAASSGAIGWVLGRESSECRRQWEPPCRHRTRRRIYPPSGGGELLVRCAECGAHL